MPPTDNDTVSDPRRISFQVRPNEPSDPGLILLELADYVASTVADRVSQQLSETFAVHLDRLGLGPLPPCPAAAIASIAQTVPQTARPGHMVSPDSLFTFSTRRFHPDATKFRPAWGTTLWRGTGLFKLVSGETRPKYHMLAAMPENWQAIDLFVAGLGGDDNALMAALRAGSWTFQTEGGQTEQLEFSWVVPSISALGKAEGDAIRWPAAWIKGNLGLSRIVRLRRTPGDESSSVSISKETAQRWGAARKEALLALQTLQGLARTQLARAQIMPAIQHDEMSFSSADAMAALENILTKDDTAGAAPEGPAVFGALTVVVDNRNQYANESSLDKFLVMPACVPLINASNWHDTEEWDPLLTYSVWGRRPAIASAGLRGNGIPANTQFQSQGLSALTLSATAGGEDVEGKDQHLARAATLLRTRGRPVTRLDWEELALSCDPTGQIAFAAAAEGPVFDQDWVNGVQIVLFLQGSAPHRMPPVVQLLDGLRSRIDLLCPIGMRTDVRFALPIALPIQLDSGLEASQQRVIHEEAFGSSVYSIPARPWPDRGIAPVSAAGPLQLEFQKREVWLSLVLDALRAGLQPLNSDYLWRKFLDLRDPVSKQKQPAAIRELLEYHPQPGEPSPRHSCKDFVVVPFPYICPKAEQD